MPHSGQRSHSDQAHGSHTAVDFAYAATEMQKLVSATVKARARRSAQPGGTALPEVQYRGKLRPTDYGFVEVWCRVVKGSG